MGLVKNQQYREELYGVQYEQHNFRQFEQFQPQETRTRQQNQYGKMTHQPTMSELMAMNEFQQGGNAPMF